MHTKEELLSEIDALIQLIRVRSNSWFALTLLPTSMARKVSDFTAQSIDLKQRVLQSSGDPVQLLDLSREYLDLETWAKRRVAKNNLLPHFLTIYVGFAVLGLIVSMIDFGAIVRKTLGVAAPEKLITLGIAGAFVYLATSLLAQTQQQSGDVPIARVIDFTLRLSLAVVVPIILVVLFFKPDGSIGPGTLTTELTSFAVGYSAKLVLDVFNKVVEKASKMIEAF